MNRFLLTAPLAAALALAADPMAGRYVLRGVPEVASELMLKPDGRFEYAFIYGAADYQSKGSWRRDGNAVVLTAEGIGTAPFRLAKSSKAPAAEFRVYVKAPNGQGVEHMDVTLDTSGGAIKQRTDHEGLATFPETPAARSVRLHVPVYDVDAGPFTVDAGQTELTFEINGEAVTRVPFKEERLAISSDGGSLEMRFWNADRPISYRKQR